MQMFAPRLVMMVRDRRSNVVDQGDLARAFVTPAVCASSEWPTLNLDESLKFASLEAAHEEFITISVRFDDADYD